MAAQATIQHASLLVRFAGSNLNKITDQATTPLSTEACNRDYFIAGLLPIINIFKQNVTFQSDDHYMECVSVSAEEADSAKQITQRKVNTDIGKLQALACGNLVNVIAIVVLNTIFGLGFTLVHGLAHLSILCSVINITDIASIANDREEMSHLVNTGTLKNVLQGPIVHDGSDSE